MTASLYLPRWKYFSPALRCVAFRASGERAHAVRATTRAARRARVLTVGCTALFHRTPRTTVNSTLRTDPAAGSERQTIGAFPEFVAITSARKSRTQEKRAPPRRSWSTRRRKRGSVSRRLL